MAQSMAKSYLSLWSSGQTHHADQVNPQEHLSSGLKRACARFLSVNLSCSTGQHQKPSYDGHRSGVHPHLWRLASHIYIQAMDRWLTFQQTFLWPLCYVQTEILLQLYNTILQMVNPLGGCDMKNGFAWAVRDEVNGKFHKSRTKVSFVKIHRFIFTLASMVWVWGGTICFCDQQSWAGNVYFCRPKLRNKFTF